MNRHRTTHALVALVICAIALSHIASAAAIQLTPSLITEFQKAAKDVSSGNIGDETSALQFGTWMSGLVCSCLTDGNDSCSQLVKDVCDPIGQAMPGLAPTIHGIGEALQDPANAMCAVGFSASGAVPPGVDALTRPSAMPQQPVESIEAVRWSSSAGPGYEYALRYQLMLSNYSHYPTIGFEVKDRNGAQSVTRLSTVQQPGNSSDLPLAVSFASRELYTNACITFRPGTVPSGLPASLCVPIREVQP